MKINEIFSSIQGESSRAGLPCSFVRLTGCNLRCNYCDTQHAYEDGEEKTIGEVTEAIGRFPTKLVEITGGEPLLQAETPALITALADLNYTVLLETNGTVPLTDVDNRAITIMDVKCPGSGMSESTDWDNIELLKPNDEVKFVLSDRTDYDWAMEHIKKYRLHEKHIIHMSPAFGVLEPSRLASWMLESRIIEGSTNVRFQLQIHKYIWPKIERGV